MTTVVVHKRANGQIRIGNSPAPERPVQEPSIAEVQSALCKLRDQRSWLQIDINKLQRHARKFGRISPELDTKVSELNKISKTIGELTEVRSRVDC